MGVLTDMASEVLLWWPEPPRRQPYILFLWGHWRTNKPRPISIAPTPLWQQHPQWAQHRPYSATSTLPLITTSPGNWSLLSQPLLHRNGAAYFPHDKKLQSPLYFIEEWKKKKKRTYKGQSLKIESTCGKLFFFFLNGLVCLQFNKPVCQHSARF